MDESADRPSWIRVVLALLVVAGALLAGAVTVALSTAPEFISGAMTQMLGRHVSIGSIQVRAGLSMSIDLSDVRIHATSDAKSEVLFEAPRAVGRQAWPRVFVGQFVPLSWILTSPVVRVRLGGGPLPEIDLPSFDLSVSNGRVDVQTPQGAYSIEKLSLSAARGLLLPTVKGTAQGVLTREKRSLGGFDAEFAGGLDSAQVRGRLQSIDLAQALPESLHAEGSASGRMTVEIDSGEMSGSVALEVSGLSLTVPQMDPIAPQEARLSARGRWSEAGVELQLDPLVLDDLVLRGPVRVSSGEQGRITLALDMDEFAPGQLSGGRINPLRLLGMRFATWRRVHDSVEGGRIADARLEIDVPRGELASLSFAKPLPPGAFHLQLRAVDGVYRASPEGEPFTDIGGTFDLQGDRMQVDVAKLRRYGQDLPRIAVSLDGFSRLVWLPLEERYVPKGPGVATPGLAAAFSALAPRSGSPAAAVPLRVSKLRLEHPALLLPLRDASAELRLRDGRLFVEQGRALVAGAPADVRAEWDRPNQKVSVEIRYDYAAAGGASAPPDRTDPIWIDGRFALERLQLGPWPLQGVEGRLSARGADVDLIDVVAQVGGGRLTASGDLSLAQSESAPIAMAIDLQDADVSEMARILSLDPEAITGRGGLRGPIRGALSADASFLATADIQVDVDLRDGTLRNLPQTLQLARLPSLQGVLGLFGRPLPYKRLDATFEIEKGVLRTERFALLGPELRILAAGEVDLKVPEKTTDMVVALLFAQTVDRVIDAVPLLGSWVLGKDENLFAIYVRLQGPWKDPQVGLVPPNSLSAAAGWAGRMIGRGMRGLRDLGDFVIPGGGRGDETAPDAPKLAPDGKGGTGTGKAERLGGPLEPSRAAPPIAP